MKTINKILLSNLLAGALACTAMAGPGDWGGELSQQNETIVVNYIRLAMYNGGCAAEKLSGLIHAQVEFEKSDGYDPEIDQFTLLVKGQLKVSETLNESELVCLTEALKLLDQK